MKKEMTLSEFRGSLNAGIPRNVLISRSVGVEDIWKKIRKNKWPNIGKHIPLKIFIRVIRKINDYVKEDLLTNGRFYFPMKLGRLYPYILTKKVWLENGKVKDNLSIDWATTTKLWYEDEEAFRDKIIVKNNKEKSYVLMYSKIAVSPKWFRFFYFKPNQALTREYNRRTGMGKLKIYTL